MRVAFFSKKNRQRGFTLPEIMIATLIFAVAVGTSMLVVAHAERLRLRANRIQGARVIASTISDWLRTYGNNACPGAASDNNDLTADVVPGNALTCMGNGVNNPLASPLQVQCSFDYPRNGRNDLRTIFGNSAVFRAPALGASGLAASTLIYEGLAYYVVWNVSCTVPSTTQKAIRVLVGWDEPATMWSTSPIRVEWQDLTKGSVG